MARRGARAGRVGLIGRVDLAGELFDGQTVKTRMMYRLLCEQYGAERVVVADTCGYRSHPLAVTRAVGRCLVRCDDIVVLLSANGRRVLFPLLAFAARYGGKRVYHNLIGGWLARHLEQHPAWVRHLNAFEVNWVESHALADALTAQGVLNAEYLPNFKYFGEAAGAGTGMRAGAGAGMRAEAIACAEVAARAGGRDGAAGRTGADDAASIDPAVGDAGHAGTAGATGAAARAEGPVPVRFCTFSRVTACKGVGDAARAVERLCAEGLPCTLDVFGPIDPSYRQAFEQVLSTCSHVFYRGCAAPERGAEAIAVYDALLFPTSWKAEGVPGTVVDALAAGVPIIAAKWPYHDEMLVDGVTGFAYPFGRNELLIDAMRRFMKPTTDVGAMRRACMARAAAYAPQAVAPRIVARIGKRGRA